MANENRDTSKIDEQAERLRKKRLNMEYGDEMQGIVRRLAEWAESDLMGEFDDIVSDAVVLWAKMRKESEGRDV